MTDTHFNPTRQAIAAVDRSLPGKVTGRLRKALDLMIWQAQRRAVAAQLAGMTDESLRSALRKPHVIAHYNRELEVLRTSERARNIARLCEIREAADNMPAVNAIKTLEMLGDEQTNKPNAPTPGVCIRIVNVTSQPPASSSVIDVTPQHEPEPVLAIDRNPIFKLD